MSQPVRWHVPLIVGLLFGVAGCGDDSGFEDPVPPGVSLDLREAAPAAGGLEQPGTAFEGADSLAPAGGDTTTAAPAAVDTAGAASQDTLSL